jgi:hypothetical protein
MASVAAILELEAELSQARDAAQALLSNCAAAMEAEDLSRHELRQQLVAWAREVSASFQFRLVRVLSLTRGSQMLGSLDADTIRLAGRRINAALRLRRHEEWGPEMLHDEGGRSPYLSEYSMLLTTLTGKPARMAQNA